jgi:hypothetical protein
MNRLDDCYCIFYHPTDPARIAELKELTKSPNVYTALRAMQMLRPCETRKETA